MQEIYLNLKEHFYASQRPDAPHGRINPELEIGSPTSSVVMVPSYFLFMDRVKMFFKTVGAKPVV